MEPEKIRVLLSTPPEQLARAARQVEMPLPIARDIRVQALNLVLGKCILCSKPTLAGMCRHCRKVAPPKPLIHWAPVELLKKLRPSDQLVRQTCVKCGGHFMLSARYLLGRLLSKSTEDTKRVCNRCVQKEETERREWAQKQKEEELKVIQERRKQQIADAKKQLEEKNRRLFHQPFQGNQVLEDLRGRLPVTRPKRKPKKGPKRA